METCTNLVLSFYQALKRDLAELNLDVQWDLTVLDGYLNDGDDSQRDTLIALCKFGKSIESALIADVKLDVPDHPLFNKGSGDSELPLFLRSLLEPLFHASGYRRHCEACVHEVNSYYVLALRQITLAFSKLVDLEPVVDEAVEIQAFVDRVCADHYSNVILHRRNSTELMNDVRSLLSDVFTTTVEKELELAAPLAQWVENPWGQHGPGAVADKSFGSQKWHFRPSKREPLGLYELYKLEEAYVEHHFWSCPDKPIPARMCIVPKDFRGHRIICIEPKELMFAQQGLMHTIYAMVHSHPLTKWSINFDDQVRSQKKCRGDRFATIDLKDASDRISLSLARVLLPKKAFAVLTRYRSSVIALPDGRTIQPKALFTMGNALCFPAQTLIFWAIAMAACRQDANDSGEFVSQTWLAKNIRVFGDDIIVPKKYARAVLAALSGCGLQPNYQKTCIDTPVRESCGAWWFGGRDVRITRFRYHKLVDYYTWTSWADNARELHSNGFTHTALHVCTLMTKVSFVPFGYLGFPGQRELKNENIRYNEELQRCEVRLPVLRDGNRLVALTDWRGLYAWFVRSATKVASRHVAHSVEWEWTGL